MATLEASDVLIALDASHLDNLRQEFEHRDMNLPEFVHVMLNFMPPEVSDTPEQLRSTVANLCEMFEEVDVNGESSRPPH